MLGCPIEPISQSRRSRSRAGISTRYFWLSKSGDRSVNSAPAVPTWLQYVFLGVVLGTSRVQSVTPTCFGSPGDLRAEHPDDRGVLTGDSASGQGASGPPVENRSVTEDAKRRSRPRGSAGVADRMADAVTYLSRLADDAGMDEISADLLSIHDRLVQESRGSTPTATGHYKKRASRRSK